MNQTQYQIAFQVEVLHSYFEQNICSCLQFVPGSATRKLMKRFKFKCRDKINGFGFYFNSDQSLDSFLGYISKTTSQAFFDFDMITDVPSFTCFTELPVNWIGDLVYDTSAPSTGYEAGTVLLKEGLSANGNPSRIGSLVVHFDDLLKFRNDNGFTQFNISFNARATQWQYYVVNKSSIPLGEATIAKSDFNFTGPTTVTIESGQQALLFSSGSNLIPLSKIPRYKFNLVNNGGPSKVVFKGLPNPDPEQFGIVSINGQNKVSSPMYVYV